MLDFSGNVKTFKLKNIYYSIEQEKSKIRTEMNAKTEKKGKEWENWAIVKLRHLINTKISYSTENSRLLHKRHTYNLEGQNTNNKYCLTTDNECISVGVNQIKKQTW